MPADHTSSTRRGALQRYALAIALVSMAMFLSWLSTLPSGNPSWFFFPVAVLASTWFGGRGPGWVAVVLSSLAVLYFFIPPPDSFVLKPQDVPFFLTFVACEVGANSLMSWRRQTEESSEACTRRTGSSRCGTNRGIERCKPGAARSDRGADAHRSGAASTRTELARVVRITTIGELTASIAHEVNQPLAAVVANADACVAWLALESPDLGEARAAAERATLGATRASEVISLHSFAH